MRTMKYKGHLLLTALLAFAFMGGFAGSTFAADNHPPVVLMDANDNPILDTEDTAYSAKNTCGGCHNYDSIEQHSYHAQISANQIVGWNPYNPDSPNKFKKGVGAKSKPWVQSPGHFGKW